MPEEPAAEVLGEALGIAADVTGAAADTVDSDRRRGPSGCGCFLLLVALALGAASIWFTMCQ